MVMSSSALPGALHKLGIHKDEDELRVLVERYSVHGSGKLSESDFLDVVRDKSKMELMLDSLPIVRALEHALLKSRPKSMKHEQPLPSIQHFIDMTPEEIIANLSGAISVITTIVLKQHEIMKRKQQGTATTMTTKLMLHII
jgi:hypothetical protein